VDTGIHIANFHISNLFPKVKRTVIASFSAAFGGGGVVFLLFSLLHSGPGWSLATLFYAFSGVSVLGMLQQLLVQQSSVFPLGGKLRFQCCFPPGFVVIAEPPLAAVAAAPTASLPEVDPGVDGRVGVPVVIHGAASEDGVDSSPPPGLGLTAACCGARGDATAAVVEETVVQPVAKEGHSPEKEAEEEPSPLWDQLASAEFWSLLVFFSLVLLAIQFYVATVEIQLEQVLLIIDIWY